MDSYCYSYSLTVSNFDLVFQSIWKTDFFQCCFDHLTWNDPYTDTFKGIVSSAVMKRLSTFMKYLLYFLDCLCLNKVCEWLLHCQWYIVVQHWQLKIWLPWELDCIQLWKSNRFLIFHQLIIRFFINDEKLINNCLHSINKIN